LQLQADVPVAAYLSGGLDSSYVAATASRLHGADLRTFSLRFTDAEFDEGEYQSAARAATGPNHTEVLCQAATIAQEFPKAIWHAEVPILRTAPVPMMLLAEQVRASGSRVVLTGEGADEILCGYDLFKEGRIRRFCARAPESQARAALFGRLYPYLKHSPVAAPAYARHFFNQGAEYRDAPYFAHIPRWQTTRRMTQYLSEDARAEIARHPLYADLEARLPLGIRRWATLNQDQYVEAHTLLSGYLLSAQGDRMAAAHGIESRVPFLDHRLIEYCNRLPPRYKLMGLNEKYLLKQAAAGVVPDRVRLRPKQPYRAPDSASFFRNEEAVDYVQYLLSEDRLRSVGYLNAAAVGKLLEKCRQGRAIGFGDNMAFVGVLSLMLLEEQFVQGRMVPADSDRAVQRIYRNDRELAYAAS
ncbi:MAG TPA: asparagine synthase C-terminal domain-containing protein, partial [Acidiferrobacteraceae bacterium]|nr:asparagine synthase C-terminal domain-containing protein [Acidiferrobacteraceae bacterium]